MSHVKAGTLQVLAVTSAERIDILPDVPTAKEQGADVDITMWRGLAAPAGTPDEVVAKLEAVAKMAVESKEFQDASKKIGFNPAYMSREDFASLIKTDDTIISDLMSDLGLKK